MQDLFLLPAYVVAETTRAILCFVAGRSGVHISITLVTFSSEALKLVVALAFLSSWIHKQPQYKDDNPGGSLKAWKHALLTGGRADVKLGQIRRGHLAVPFEFAVPACLYLVNNILYLVGVQMTTVSLLHAIMFAKLPFTALLHHLLVKKQTSYRVWLSLLVICAGLAIYASPSSTQNDTSRFHHSSVPLLGLAIGLILAVISGFASVYTELLTKADVAFWVAQVWLYLWGTIIAAAVGLCWDGKVYQTALHTLQASRVSSREIASYHCLVILATAGVGLVAANILRKQDNLVKLVGASICVVTILVAQIFLFPELRARSSSPAILLGLGLITVGAWLYNYLISQKSTSLALSSTNLSCEEDGHPLLQEKEEAFSRVDGEQHRPAARMLPNTAKVGVVLAAWGILAAIVWQAKLYSLPYTSYTDSAQFFEPLNITRTEWGHDTERADPRCIERWVRNAKVLPKSHELSRIEKLFPQTSACPVYPVPDGGLAFHMFFYGPHRPFHRVAIDAFLATQRLRDGHRLLYWIDESDHTWNETVEFYRTHEEYRHFVSFQHFDPAKEAQGTCLETMPEYNDPEYRKSVEMPLVSWSDLVRVLLLTKYGGVWVDTDTLLLRDMTPYIRMGPSAPSIPGTSKHNNNLLVVGPPGTGLGSTLMSTACSIPYLQKDFVKVYRDVQLPKPWYWLYNDGLLKICEQHTHCGFSRVPWQWVDVWWAPDASIQEELRPCSEDWAAGSTPAPAQLHGIFAWHARLYQVPDECVTNATQATGTQLVMRRIREALDDGLEMGGRDLFPGPGYA